MTMPRDAMYLDQLMGCWYLSHIHKVIIQISIHSYLVRLNFLVLCLLQAMKAQLRLCISIGLYEPWLLAYAMMANIMSS